jgi:hypothetical protein
MISDEIGCSYTLLCRSHVDLASADLTCFQYNTSLSFPSTSKEARAWRCPWAPFLFNCWLFSLLLTGMQRSFDTWTVLLHPRSSPRVSLSKGPNTCTPHHRNTTPHSRYLCTRNAISHLNAMRRYRHSNSRSPKSKPLRVCGVRRRTFALTSGEDSTAEFSYGNSFNSAHGCRSPEPHPWKWNTTDSWGLGKEWK